MNSRTTNEILKSLAIQFGYSKETVRYMILRLFEASYQEMSRSTKEGSPSSILISGLGKLYVPYYKSLLMLTAEISDKNKEIMENENNWISYHVTMQGGRDRTFENNMPFYFMMKDRKAPKLNIGDKIYFKIGNRVPMAIGDARFFYLEGEILDSGEPFYKAAVSIKEDVDEHTKDIIVFRKNLVKKIFVKK